MRQENAISPALWLVESANDWECDPGDCANKVTLDAKAIWPGGERGLQYPQLSVQIPPLCNKFKHQLKHL